MSVYRYIFCSVQFLLLLILCWCFCGVESWNAYDYDLTTPMFTPDGRLLQVEYAFESSRHSSPLLAIPCEDGVVLATTPYYSRDRIHRRQQSRFVEILGNTNNSTMAVVGLSGVIADAMSLLQHARKHVDSWSRLYGTSPGMLNPARQIANVVADACQSHALGGGIRPYGASLLVCSLQKGPQYKDGSAQSEQPPILATIAITHPSGAVHSATVTCSSKPNNNPTPVFVMGGTTDVQAKIKDRVEAFLLQQDRNTDNKSLKRTIHIAIEALLEEYDKNKQQQLQQDQSGEDDEAEMEIVIMSPTHGTHRLSRRDIRILVARTRELQRLREVS